MRRKFIAKPQTPFAFSIIEVIIGISFLTVGILGVAQMFPLGLQIGKNSENSTIGTILGQAKIENVISLGYDNISTGVIETKQHINTGSFGDVYSFSRQTNVSYVDGNLSPSASDTGMKEIEVEVFWLTSSGERSVILKRLISRR